MARRRSIDAGQRLAQSFHPFSLLKDARFAGLISIEYRFGKISADPVLQFPQQFTGLFGMLVDADAESQAELCIVLEQRLLHAGPRPSPFLHQGVVGRLPP